MKPKHSAVLIRRKTIMDMMLSGHTHADLVSYYVTNYSALTEHSLEKDITWAYDNLKYYINKNADDVINRHIMYYDQIIRDSINSPFKGDAIKAMQAKEKLLGLSKPETQVNLQVNNNTVQVEHLSFDELQKLINSESD